MVELCSAQGHFTSTVCARKLFVNTDGSTHLRFDTGTAETSGFVALHVVAPGTRIQSSGSVVVGPVDAFVFLVGVEFGPVHGLDVLPKGAGVRVPFCTTRCFAHVRFL